MQSDTLFNLNSKTSIRTQKQKQKEQNIFTSKAFEQKQSFMN